MFPYPRLQGKAGFLSDICPLCLSYRPLPPRPSSHSVAINDYRQMLGTPPRPCRSLCSVSFLLPPSPCPFSHTITLSCIPLLILTSERLYDCSFRSFEAGDGCLEREEGGIIHLHVDLHVL
jgi:hypothetical protein